MICLAIAEREREWFAPLEEVIKKPITGSRPSGGVAGYTEGAISLGGEQIGSDGKLNLDKIPYVPLEFYNNAKSGFVKDEDILICKDGALTGKVCFVDFRLFRQKEVMTNEHIFIIRAKTDIIMQKYLFYMLKSQAVQDRIVELAYNKTAQAGLNQQHFKNITIPLHNLSTQQQMVTEIEQEEKIIVENKKLIEIMTNKMRNKLDILIKHNSQNKPSSS